MLQLRDAMKDVLAGGVFIVLGLAFSIGALQLDVGTPLRMGPGYFPLVLGILLIGLGIAIGIKGFLAGSGDEIGGVHWRAMLLITAGVLFFGLTIRGLGAALALFGAILLAALARSETRAHEAVLIALGLSTLSVILFIVILQLRLPLIGPWLPF